MHAHWHEMTMATDVWTIAASTQMQMAVLFWCEMRQWTAKLAPFLLLAERKDHQHSEQRMSPRYCTDTVHMMSFA